MTTRTHLLLRAALVACLGVGCTDTSQAPDTPAAPVKTTSAPLTPGMPFLVKDLTSGALGASYLPQPGAFAAVGSTVFFVADDGVTGKELWKTDGTAPGITLVADLLPGPESSEPSNLTAMGGKLYFGAATSAGYRAPGTLWSSDGTAEGTRPMLVLGGTPSFITQRNGTLYFEAPILGASSGFTLWKSDGTPQGTVPVKSLGASMHALYTAFAWVGDTLFFSVQDDSLGHTLWKSDGTAAGTVLVKDVLPSTSSYDRLFKFTSANGVLFFQAPGINDWRYQLWRSDGTAAGTFPLLFLQSSYGTGSAPNLIAAGNVAYFPRWDSASGNELWRTDGTVAGTTRMTDLLPGNLGSSPMSLVGLGSELYFYAKTDIYGGWALWKSNGTSTGTVKVPLPAGWSAGGEYSPPMAASPNAVFFMAGNGSSAQLWKTDETAAGTVQVSNVDAYTLSGATPRGWFAGAMYLMTTTDRLWRSDGTPSGTAEVGLIHQLQSGSSLRDSVNLGGSLFFINGTPGGSSLWSSDGTEPNTSTAGYSSYVAGLERAGGRIFYWDHTHFSDPIETFTLSSTDGSSLGTSYLKSFSEERDSSDRNRLPSTAVLGGNIFFAVDPSGNKELPALWKSDGTAEGTVAAVTVRQDAFVLTPRLVTTVGDRLFFAAGFGFGSDALWTSDGTEAGTRKLKDFTASDYSWPLRYFTAVGGTLYFWANTQTEGPSLWKSDGTAAGTVLVTTTNAAAPAPSTTGTLNGELYFASAPAQQPPQLWKTNGLQVVQVASFGSIKAGPVPSQFTELNGALLFWAYDETHGYELWRTDGTAAGTVLVKDINPGPASAVGTPGPLVALGPAGPLLFAASDGVSGLELWQTDGTAAGTVRLADIVPGPASSSPTALAVAGPHLFFQAWTADTGTELWALSRPVTDTDPPQLTCPAPQVAEATSQFGAPVTYSPATATDASGVQPVLRYSQRSGGYFSLGKTAVTVTALDDSANRATCTFDITVQDTHPPTITCPSSSTVEADRAGGGLFMGYPGATAQDVASSPTVSYVPASGSTIPVGTTTVLATATDGVGLKSTCTFSVTVTDTVAPSLYQCPGAFLAEATSPEGATVNYPLPTAYDVVAPPEVTGTPAVGSRFALGRTDVTVVARDGAGNEARCTFPVTVADTTPPSIECPPAQSVEATSADGATVQWPAATATDSVSPTQVSYSQEPGSMFPIGNRVVTATATDASGNRKACSFIVNVRKKGEPDPTNPSQPSERGCGCGQSGDQEAALLGLALLAALWLRRAGGAQ